MEAILARKETALRRFEDFYRAEFERVFKAVYLTSGDRDGALDATQEAFKRAYVRWRKLSRKEWAGGWAMTTALNAYREVHRRRNKFMPGDVEQKLHFPPGPERLDVVDALRKLPQRQRTAIVLYYLGDLPIPVVADFMAITEGAVKAHLAQARATLRTILEARDA
jgi:RNA polymerase sigma-70 factor (ECF subfamily)